MFSANENLQLRQHKRRIVAAVEATIPDEALDLGTNVMVMQVACQEPGCVPIETAVVVVFPASETELIAGLAASAGRSFKTKILKPMADVVTPDDVLDALPPQFAGGRRTVERLALSLRDVVLAQVGQVAGGTTTADPDAVDLRRRLAQYLQAALDEYVLHDCVPPPLNEPYAETFETEAKTTTPHDEKQTGEATSGSDTMTEAATITNSTSTLSTIPSTGNFVMRRPKKEDVDDNSVVAEAPAAHAPTTSSVTASLSTATTTSTLSSSPSPLASSSRASATATSSSSSLPLTTATTSQIMRSTTRGDHLTPTTSQTIRSTTRGDRVAPPRLTDNNNNNNNTSFDSVGRRRQQAAATRNLLAGMRTSGLVPPHAAARGIRRPGCPCCDPDNPSNVVDQMMQL